MVYVEIVEIHHFVFAFNGHKHYALTTLLPFSDKERDCKDNAKFATDNEKRYFLCRKRDFLTINVRKREGFKARSSVHDKNCGLKNCHVLKQIL